MPLNWSCCYFFRLVHVSLFTYTFFNIFVQRIGTSLIEIQLFIYFFFTLFQQKQKHTDTYIRAKSSSHDIKRGAKERKKE